MNKSTNSRLIDMSDVAAIITEEYDIKIGRNKLFNFLRTQGIVTKRGRVNYAAPEYINKGYFIMKKPPKDEDQIWSPKPMVTFQGIGFIVALLKKHRKMS